MINPNITMIYHHRQFSSKDKFLLYQISSSLYLFYQFRNFIALDPLFWVAHGAMERTFQKSVFSGIFTDMIYNTSDKCSGHDSSESKYWLKGLYFVDETVGTHELSNEELTGILDPSSDQYRDLLNFVYDTSSFDFCSDSDSWFA